jgi:hypothetical protein
MSPLISRATDNLGLIFSLQLGGAGGPVPVQEFAYDIELFGEGISDVPFRVGDRVEGDPDLPTQTVSGSGGGYTKLNMKSLTSSEISLEPQLYIGGFRDNSFSVVTRSDGLVTSSYSGDFINDRDGVVTASTSRLVDVGDTTTVINGPVIPSAGDAAAFSIDGEWMGIAGGGTFSYVRYSSATQNRATGEFPPRDPSQFREQNSLTIIQAIDTNPLNSGGYGGFNEDDPTASPSSGENQTLGTYSRESISFTSPFDGPDFSSLVSYGGAGGGGAPGGNASDPSISQPSTGGKGNIRIYADKNGIGAEAFGGPIASVPGTEMTLDNFNIASEFGPSKVRLTASRTGLGITYTDNKVESLRELKALLDPELEFAFDIELYGEGLGDIGLFNSGAVDPGFIVGPVPSDSLKGGYTKLRMIVPSSASSISFLPKTYSGGVNTITGSQFGGEATSYSFTSESTGGGDAAAFSIDGEWMGIAGGSGVVRYQAEIVLSDGGFAPKQEITLLEIPNVPGRGGVNVANPKASPGRGGDILSENNPVTFFSNTQLATQIFGGAGGGGAGGGPAATPGVSAAEGGGGNIRVYEQTDGTSDTGDILLPGIDPIYMRLENSIDNFWLGASKVVVSHPVTGASLEFTSDTTISIRELRALLIPTEEIAFEVELFGQGFKDETALSLPGEGSYTAPYPYTNVSIPRSEGGYTKLLMIVPISDANNISLQPKLYSAGIHAVNSIFSSGSDISRNFDVTYPLPDGFGPAAAGDAAAFSINGEWMAVAGGGSWSYAFTDSAVSPIIGPGDQRFLRASVSSVTVSTDVGKGGVNLLDPTAAPGKGQNQTNGSFFGTEDFFYDTESSGPQGGGGGGGAPPGTAVNLSVTPAIPSTAGGGNIRIWSDTNGVDTKGDLTSVSGVYMELLDSQDGLPLETFFGTPQDRRSTVTITNKATGQSITRTNAAFSGDQTLTIKELREIFYPGVFPPA